MLLIINKKDISFGHNQNRNLHTTCHQTQYLGLTLHCSLTVFSHLLFLSCLGFCPSLLSTSPTPGRRSRRCPRPTSFSAAAWLPRRVTTSCPGSASTTSSASSRRSASTAPRTRASHPCVQETKSSLYTQKSFLKKD